MAEITNQVSDHQTPASDLRSLPADLRNPASDLRSLPSGLCPSNPSAPRLPAPVRITEQVWPEGTVPVVSVFCITYNHVNFIRDAIEGFLMQETTFPVEIFIHDDASTDGTAEIVKEYAEKYPKLFWTVLQTENQWSKGNPNAYFFGLMQKQRGEFIALCEGDDYWTCKEKLQKQVVILGERKGLVGCCHEVFTDNPESRARLYNRLSGEITHADMLQRNDIGTLSVMIRATALIPLSPKFDGLLLGDWPRWITATQQGAFWFDDKPMAFYRKHEGGIWSKLPQKEQYLSILDMLCRASLIIEPQFRLDSISGIARYYATLLTFSLLRSNESVFAVANSFIENSAWQKSEILLATGNILMKTAWVDNAPKNNHDLPPCSDVESEMINSMNLASKNPVLVRNILAQRVFKLAWFNKVINAKFSIDLFKKSFDYSQLTFFLTAIQCFLKSLINCISSLFNRLVFKIPIAKQISNTLVQRKCKALHKIWINSLKDKKIYLDHSVIFTGKGKMDSMFSFGSECIIDSQVCVWLSENASNTVALSLGKKAYIGRGSYIGVHDSIAIGDYTSVGAYCYIISANHLCDSRDIPISEQGFYGAPINIGNDVWIGTHVVVLPGVSIGDGAIIGAGSIVNRSIPAYEVWAGNPARFIKKRP